MSSGPDQFLIRPAVTADVRALGRLGAVLVSTHHEFDPERFIAAAPGTENAYGSCLVAQLQNPYAVVSVAELG